MSANNQLVVSCKNLVWTIKNIDVDGCGGFPVGDEYPDLESAIRAAEDYMRYEEVEYGYRVILPKTK
jgi:hypothetical protein